MYTTLFLVRNADTDFSRDGRVAGRRDIGLSAAGRAQAGETATGWSPPSPTSSRSWPRRCRAPSRPPRSSPPPSATASCATRASSTSTPDAGKRSRTRTSAPRPSTSASSPTPSPSRSPAARRSATCAIASSSSVSQALADNELGANILIVSHAGPLRVLLAHYLGMNLVHYHRLRLSPASVSILRFESEAGVPRILTINCTADPGPALR